MWYVGGSRPDWAQVGSYLSWGTVVPKGFLAKSAYFSSCTLVTQPRPNQRGHLYIRVNLRCTKNGPWQNSALALIRLPSINKLIIIIINNLIIIFIIYKWSTPNTYQFPGVFVLLWH